MACDNFYIWKNQKIFVEKTYKIFSVYNVYSFCLFYISWGLFLVFYVCFISREYHMFELFA